jgi:tRNA nucleotidyltransferase (CCA-adding enzyme)
LSADTQQLPGLRQPHDPVVDGLQVFIVGGAVRDALLGLPAGDLDWVVVGASPEQMAQRGFTPVGGDFPVFLHPRTRQEYALARTERKSGRGYKGFTFYTGTDVSLEDDLRRRDLTINAIACTPQGDIVDPLSGQADIRARVLRHVGPAFAEDPVRLLRLARFAARFHDFSIAPETLQLARLLVQQGEVDALVPERVWQELAKGLMSSASPARMFDVLQQTGALERVIPGLLFDSGTQTSQLECAAACRLTLPGRFALVCHQSCEPAAIARHVRASSECTDYARLLPVILKGHALISAEPVQGGGLQPAQGMLDLLEACDGFRKPERFLDLLEAAGCVVPGLDITAWANGLRAVRAIDAGAIARSAAGDPTAIKQALREARLKVLAACT